MYVQSASCSILPDISGCFERPGVVHFVAVCTNREFMRWWSLASLKHTIDGVISRETVRCMERRNEKKEKTGNFACRNVC